jgi:hypothetical protein
MLKPVGVACTFALICFLVKPANDTFSRYKTVEAYEIRLGILMMPTYSHDGQICQAVLEKQHYLNGKIVLDSGMPHELVMQIVDELVPDSEKGPLLIDPEFARLWLYAGVSASWLGDYKNVSIDIARLQSAPGDIVAVIKWKNRPCQ